MSTRYWSDSLQQYLDTGVYVVNTASTSSANVGTWNSNSNHNTGTAVDFSVRPGILEQIRQNANQVIYEPLTYQKLEDTIREALFPEESIQKEEPIELGFFKLLTIVNKEKTNE